MAELSVNDKNTIDMYHKALDGAKHAAEQDMLERQEIMPEVDHYEFRTNPTDDLGYIAHNLIIDGEVAATRLIRVIISARYSDPNADRDQS